MMPATSTTRRDAATRAPLIRPPAWEPFYKMRSWGLVPVEPIMRVTLSGGLVVARALEIPSDVGPWALDLSPVAGLDAFLIFDGERERFGRVRDAAGAILRHDPASLELWDAPQEFEPRRAVLKRAAFSRRLRLEAAHG